MCGASAHPGRVYLLSITILLLCCAVGMPCWALCCLLQDKVEARNADYAKIVRHLHFHNVPTDKPQQQSQYDAADSVVLPGGGGSNDSSFSPRQQQQLQQQQQHGLAAAAGSGGGGGGGSPGEEDWGAGMKDAEFLVWLGDFNYRVDQPKGFVPDRSNPDCPVNEQLYHFVLQKVREGRTAGCAQVSQSGHRDWYCMCVRLWMQSVSCPGLASTVSCSLLACVACPAACSVD